MKYFIGNLIIAFESTSTSRNYVIVYVNDEDSVLIIYYAVKFIHIVSHNIKGRILSSPVGDKHNESVDDVVITTQREVLVI